MFEAVLRAMGRGLMVVGTSVITLLWGVVVEVVRGAGRGLGRVTDKVIPWLIGAGVVWGVVVFAPGLFQTLAVLGIMVFGLKIMVQGFLPPPKKRK